MPDQHIDEVTCAEFVTIVTDYMEGVLPEDQVELIEEHLVMCDWCKTFLDQMEMTIKALPDAAVDEPIAPDTRAALMGMFRDWKAER